MIMVSLRSRPTCDRSWGNLSKGYQSVSKRGFAYLDVISLVVVAAISKKAMMDNFMDI